MPVPCVLGIDPGSAGAGYLLRVDEGEKPRTLGAFAWKPSGEQIILDSVDSISPSLSLERFRVPSVARLGWVLGQAVAHTLFEWNQHLGLTLDPQGAVHPGALRLEGVVVEMQHLGKKNPQAGLRLARHAWTLAGAFEAYWAAEVRSLRTAPLPVRAMEVGSWRTVIGCAIKDREQAQEKIFATVPHLVDGFEPMLRRLGGADHIANAAGLSVVAGRCRVWDGAEKDFQDRAVLAVGRSPRERTRKKKDAAAS